MNITYTESTEAVLECEGKPITRPAPATLAKRDDGKVAFTFGIGPDVREALRRELTD